MKNAPINAIIAARSSRRSTSLPRTNAGRACTGRNSQKRTPVLIRTYRMHNPKPILATNLHLHRRPFLPLLPRQWYPETEETVKLQAQFPITSQVTGFVLSLGNVRTVATAASENKTVTVTNMNAADRVLLPPVANPTTCFIWISNANLPSWAGLPVPASCLLIPCQFQGTMSVRHTCDKHFTGAPVRHRLPAVFGASRLSAPVIDSTLRRCADQTAKGQDHE